MLADIQYPSFLLPSELDAYLENAWFRLGQGIFTTNFLKFDESIYSAFWLRIELTDFQLSKSQQRLVKQNSCFRVAIQDAAITDEMEELYLLYKQSISFDTSESLVKLLYSDPLDKTIFTTKTVCVYDKEKLIGVGFFDLGKIATEGIVAVYHPDYKKYSLGKFLMIQKMLYAKTNGYSYFYPGYIAPNYKLFEYKRELGKGFTFYYNITSKQWEKLENLRAENFPITIINQKLTELTEVLSERNIPFELSSYLYFDVNLYKQFYGNELLEHPKIVTCFSINYRDLGIVIYDFIKQKYQLWLCLPAFEINSPKQQPHFFTSHLLKPTEMLISDESAENVAHRLQHIFSSGTL